MLVPDPDFHSLLLEHTRGQVYQASNNSTVVVVVDVAISEVLREKGVLYCSIYVWPCYVCGIILLSEVTSLLLYCKVNN